eukprot:TRINITY_DN20_c0_g1_i10.p1 TRINITY_DN20_c0_g1~~TRINITY_DN20_c0_g1_i10.p1  ORF type:complete len:365 (-),score=131.89 TRINITY_DN20_c0_g1_i10:200-1294(-)
MSSKSTKTVTVAQDDGMPSRKFVTLLQFDTVKPLELPEQGTWHRDRKRAILKKYPQVEKLFGNEPLTCLLLIFLLPIHTYVALALENQPWWVVLLASYTIGTLLSFQLLIIAHEATHELVFKNQTANRFVNMFGHLPNWWGPFGNFWWSEHRWHHSVVVDKALRYGPQNVNFLRKAFFTLIFIHIINFTIFVTSLIQVPIYVISTLLHFLGLRKNPNCFLYIPPYDRFPICASGWMVINFIITNIYHASLFYFGGWNPIIYQTFSSGFCNGLHPIGMRQVQEHYLLAKKQPTTSVYPPFSWLYLHIGHHVEHHDFAKIPWNRLPELRRIAPDFYDNLKYYNSYMEVLIYFFTNDGIPVSIFLEN